MPVINPKGTEWEFDKNSLQYSIFVESILAMFFEYNELLDKVKSIINKDNKQYNFMLSFKNLEKIRKLIISLLFSNINNNVNNLSYSLNNLKNILLTETDINNFLSIENIDILDKFKEIFQNISLEIIILVLNFKELLIYLKSNINNNQIDRNISIDIGINYIDYCLFTVYDEKIDNFEQENGYNNPNYLTIFEFKYKYGIKIDKQGKEFFRGINAFLQS